VTAFVICPEDFERITRETGQVLKHRAHPVWIVHYESSKSPAFSVYRVYRAVARVPHGRDPWTVDNRCIGQRDGVASLGEAIEIAREAAGIFGTAG
jgi:hypothetical protein